MLTKQIRLFKKITTLNPYRASFNFLDQNDASRRTTQTIGPDNMPMKSHFKTATIEKQEIESRMLKIASQFQEMNIKTFNWENNFKDLGLDSLNRIAYITSVEEEFNMVFPDRVFDNFDTPRDVRNYIQSSIHSF